MQSIELNNIIIQDKFWKNNMELVRKKVIPYQWKILNDEIKGASPSCCIKNFRVAANLEEGTFYGMVFQDSDLYKWLEAVAYSLMWHPDKALEATADSAIELIGKAQQPDGYLDTYYIINGLDERFTCLNENHELYCLGHMIEASVAYYQATGKRGFMDIAIRFVDLVDSIFGNEEGKIKGYPGHEVIEMALIKLYDVTKEEKHLNLAKYFIDQRGQEPLYFEQEINRLNKEFKWKDSYFQYQYYQAGKPVRKQDKAEGHAVRAVYLYAGMVDVAYRTQDKELFKACERLWNNIVEKQMYINGTVGASSFGESFTYDYHLPNDTMYGETCASVGLIFFAKRMFDITKDSKYTDIIEWSLHNGVISGMSLDGNKFFYCNPLEVVPETVLKANQNDLLYVQRQKWFGCACCPPNVARLLSSLGGYAYEQEDNILFMNLFIGGTVKTVMNQVKTDFCITTEYPWDGNVEINVNPERAVTFTYAIRVPKWCRSCEIKINGENINISPKKGYVYLTNEWKAGDRISIHFTIEVEIYKANPKVREDIGKAAVVRGPILYCMEEADNGAGLHRIRLTDHPKFTAKYEPNLLNGVVTMESDGEILTEESWGCDELYKPYDDEHYKKVKLKWIPYYVWANRHPGEMIVWVRK